MVIRLRYVLVLLVLLGSFDSRAEEVQISMFAMAASNEGRQVQYIDPSLNKVRHAVERLNYDTFKRLTSTDTSLTFGKDTTLRITDRYSLILTPVKRESDNRVRIRARVEMISKDGRQKKNALDTYLAMAPGKPLNLGGLKLENGDLIIVLVTT